MTMTTPSRLISDEPEILTRIRKLMALSDRAGTPAEAAVASSKMQELLTQFNLTRADVEASNTDDGTVKMKDAPRERTNHARAALYKYQQDLMLTIAGNNFCMYLIRKQRGKVQYNPETQDYENTPYAKSHVLIGRSENVAASIMMYDYLIDTMNRLLPFVGVDRRSSDARLWLAGCADTLCERLRKLRLRQERERDAQKKGPTLTPGLVRLTDLYATEEDLNEDFRCGLEPGTTTKARLADEAEERGIEEKRIQLQRELEAKESELIKSGVDPYEAYYVARGRSQEFRNAPGKVRRRRESRATGAAEDRSYYAQERRERQEQARLNHPSYRAGQRRGSEIGLGGALKEAGTSGPKKLGKGD